MMTGAACQPRRTPPSSCTRAAPQRDAGRPSVADGVDLHNMAQSAGRQHSVETTVRSAVLSARELRKPCEINPARKMMTLPPALLLDIVYEVAALQRILDKLRACSGVGN